MEAERPSACLPQPADALARIHARFRLVLGAFTLTMLALSWPLWVYTTDFPRVPFVASLPQPPDAVSWLLFGALLAAIAASCAGMAWRRMLALSVAICTWLVLGDQHRFQPWLYQFALTGLALATLPARRALALSRLLIVAIYVHSGLSKLDISFCRELGEAFLETLVRPIGLAPEHWPVAVRFAIILTMPAAELAIGLGLAFRRTRRPALAGAIALHAVLLFILGPWGLQHSTIVLVWNAAFIAEDLVLFGWEIPDVEDEPARESRLAPLTIGIFAVAVLMPLGERAGVWDTWPSFGLYASHAERTTVLVSEADAAILPPAAARHARAVAGTSWLEVDLTGWSREVRGVPVYPQARACLGLAEALAARGANREAVGVAVWSRAALLTGERTRVDCWGLDAIRRQGDHYRLNAHPARDWQAKEARALRKD